MPHSVQWQKQSGIKLASLLTRHYDVSTRSLIRIGGGLTSSPTSMQCLQVAGILNQPDGQNSNRSNPPRKHEDRMYSFGQKLVCIEARNEIL